MDEYKCARCGYVTKIKGNMVLHFKRKVSCNDVLLSNISIDQLAKALKKPEIYGETITCKLCEKEVSKTNYSRHYKICKSKNNDCTMESLKGELVRLREEIKHMRNNGNTPVVNNNTVNISITNVNNFGNESYDHISNDFIKTCMMSNLGGVKQLIEKIHFSEDAPNNKNVRLKSLKNNLVEVADNQKWVVRDANEAMETMINKGCKLLNGYYQNPDNGCMEYDINELDNHIQTFLMSIIDKNNKHYFSLRRRILALIIEHSDQM